MLEKVGKLKLLQQRYRNGNNIDYVPGNVVGVNLAVIVNGVREFDEIVSVYGVINMLINWLKQNISNTHPSNNPTTTNTYNRSDNRM